MKIKEIIPPREFETGYDVKRTIFDCARIDLKADEQVTFTTPQGAEYDVVRKDFGYYATPSINGRLKEFGLRTALVGNKKGRYYILLVERGREELFEKYRIEEKVELITWLDDDAILAMIRTKFGK